MKLLSKCKQQIESMIGTKVTVYLSLRKYAKILRKDKDGLYIRFQHQKIYVHPDKNALDVLFFTGLLPKDLRHIDLEKYKKQYMGE